MEQIRWAPAPSRSLFSLFIDQFKDFMIITLLLAAAISFAAAFFTKQGDYIDPFIILAILIMNACFGVYQELRAHQALKSLTPSRHLTVWFCGREKGSPFSLPFWFPAIWSACLWGI